MTEQCLSPFATDFTPLDGWFVTAGHPLIHQRFFAAIDGTGHLCWTDDAGLAEQFPEREDAERFAALFCAEQDWAVTR